MKPWPIFALAIAACGPTSTEVSGWQKIEIENGSPIYFDVDSLRRDGDNVFVWHKSTFSSQADATEPSGDLLQLMRVNCANRTYSTLEYVFPDDVEAFSVTDEAVETNHIQPDSGMEILLDKVCG